MVDKIRETAVTIDHDLNIVHVDTTERGMASKFRRMGLTEITAKSSHGYFRFKGGSANIGIYGKRKANANPRQKPPKQASKG